MTTPVVQRSLEERITTRLHESIGDLITDEDLKGMVARGIETALFQGRREERRRQFGGGTDTYDKPPLIEEQVNKLLSEKMRVAIDTWLAENPEKIQAAIDHAIKMGVASAVQYALDNRFAGLFTSGVSELQNRGLLPR